MTYQEIGTFIRQERKVYENAEGELKERMVLEKNETYHSKTIQGFALKTEEVFDFD